MIISVDIEKAFDKINYSSMIKILNKPGTEENYFSIIKGISEGRLAGSVGGVCSSRSRACEFKALLQCRD